MLVQDALQGCLRLVPRLQVADIALRPRAQSESVLEIKDAVEAVRQLKNTVVFFLYLLLHHKNVRVILLKFLRPQQAMQRSRPLVAMQRIAVREPQRQIPVTARLEIENDHRVGTVHWLNAVRNVLVDRDKKHLLPVMLPVSRNFPDPSIVDQRRRDLLVAPLLVLAAPEVDQFQQHLKTLRQPVGHAWRAGIKMEQLKLFAQLAVVALQRLLTRPTLTDEWVLARHNVCHAPLDLWQILRGKRAW